MTESAITKIAINRVYSERFGGLNDVQLDLGGPGLVTVYGPNEAGKTRFATLLSWLLVGPSGDAATLERLGSPTDQLAGYMEGSFGSDPLRITGKFTLLQRGLPNTKDLRITKGTEQMNLSGWQTVLGGIDPKVLGAIYRLWGADLHDDNDVLQQIAHNAMAGLAGTRRIGDVHAELEDQFKALVSSQSKEAVSWRALDQQAKNHRGEISGIQKDASIHRESTQRIAEIDRELTALRSRRRERETHKASLHALKDVIEDRTRLKDVQAKIAGLESVPELWAEPLMSVNELSRLAVDITTFKNGAEASAQALDRESARLGIDEAIAAGLVITPPVVTDIKLLEQSLKTSKKDLQTKVSNQVQARNDHDRANAAATDALADAQVTATDLAGLRISTEEERTIRTALQKWRTAEEQLEQTSDQVAALELGAATLRRDQAEAAWDRFGTGIDAAKWQARGAPTTATASPMRWIAPGAAAVSLLAVLALPRWPAVGVVAAMVIAVVAATMTRPREVVTAGEPGAQVSEAAVSVLSARNSFDEATREVTRRQSEIQGLRQKCDTRRNEVVLVLAALPIEVGATADRTEDAFNALRRAVDASGSLHKAQELLSNAESAVTEAEAAVNNAIDEILQQLHAAGVPDRLGWEFVLDQIDDFAALCAQFSLAKAESQKHQKCLDQFHELTAPVSDLIIGLPHSAVVAEAERLLKIEEDRRGLTNKESELGKRINQRIGADKGAQVLAPTLNSSEINEQFDLTSEEIEGLHTEMAKLNEERGGCNQIVHEVERKEKLAELQVKAGGLEELALEQLLEGVVHLVAKKMIGHAVAERRRNHQPAIVARANQMLTSVTPMWDGLLLDPADSGSAELSLISPSGMELSFSRLSTGARALTLLALRLANAEVDAERRRVRFPIICDDPLVHFDDQRAEAVIPLLAHAANRGHQVILFTCHDRTVRATESAGARVVTLV